jgi:hypothetical protein
MVIIAVLGVWSLIGYAVLTADQQDIRNKTGKVWAQIQRAEELLPRLEQQLNTSIQLQKDLVDKIAAARSAVDTASHGDTSNPSNINQATDSMLIALRAFNENYPNIGLPEVQRGLLDETTGSFNRITYARTELIDAQTSYNTAKRIFLPLGLAWPDQPVFGENQNPGSTLPPSKVGATPSAQAIVPTEVGILPTN